MGARLPSFAVDARRCPPAHAGDASCSPANGEYEKMLMLDADMLMLRFDCACAAICPSDGGASIRANPMLMRSESPGSVRSEASRRRSRTMRRKRERGGLEE